MEGPLTMKLSARDMALVRDVQRYYGQTKPVPVEVSLHQVVTQGIKLLHGATCGAVAAPPTTPASEGGR